MRIILTHEVADFDAIASLLGAYYIDSESIPVLPRKINRNVRGFLTLYGAELPFVELRDLPSEPIDQVTLVDTQTMASIRGVTSETKVHVIDHHPLRDDVPAEWTITLSATGANTTLLIELMRSKEVAIKPVHATLLLLGIYEDTGALTYTRTTPRDLHAAAFLLEQGASLAVLRHYLYIPLSDEQMRVFHQLQSNCRTLNIHGYRVVIAKAEVGSLEEELSTVAHKLRDILEPDALFVLVQGRSGVQLIARSTQDEIDVAKVAQKFGGGGHERAAACLVKDRAIDELEKELVDYLKEVITPAIVVEQIYSRDPQLIPPEMNVSEIASLMQKYGHEGYPVVENGRVIGLVTRRAVDRALAHKLNLSARQIMEAGQVTVSPEDTLETVQTLMLTSGWGQIPVVDQKGRVIGIVTRTDVIKTLPIGGRLPVKVNLASRLEKALPPAQITLLKMVSQVASENRLALYIVGGFVRDLLLEKPSVDFDLVVEGDAIALAKALRAQFGGRLTKHDRFRTAKWFIDKTSPLFLQAYQRMVCGDSKSASLEGIPETLDFVTARTEFYPHPTALPTVEPSSIKLDLHRRDFTVNTLAIRLDGSHYGELHDYWGGLSDLRRGVVRVLHSLSFVDDPTRILRAVRFEQRFHFRIEERTLQLILEARPLLSRVSGERIRHELELIFVEDRVLAILNRLQELQILEYIHPRLKWDEWIELRSQRLWKYVPQEFGIELELSQTNLRCELFYLFLLARFEQESLPSVIERLKLPAALRKKVRDLNRLWGVRDQLSRPDPLLIVSQMDGIDPLVAYALALMDIEGKLSESIKFYFQKWLKTKCFTNGQVLRQRGLPPGPVYREILTQLKLAWIEGKINSPEEERELLEDLVQRSRLG
ncbi:MAG: CBS domain-containing protein [Anaerolineales bacterium]|nr:CBS domain-containing protein [Anaerolineales bacterium]MDW8160607.1 CBS domain-containing protein [Anaerolineales bacterium]